MSAGEGVRGRAAPAPVEALNVDEDQRSVSAGSDSSQEAASGASYRFRELIDPGHRSPIAVERSIGARRRQGGGSANRQILQIQEFGGRFVGNVGFSVYGGLARAAPGPCRTTTLAPGSWVSSRGDLGLGSRKRPGRGPREWHLRMGPVRGQGVAPPDLRRSTLSLVPAPGINGAALGPRGAG
jgi:hypothetical protein